MATPVPDQSILDSSRLRPVLLLTAVFAFFLSAYVFTATGDIFSTGDTTIRMELAENISGRASIVLNGWHLQFPHHFKKEYLDPRVDLGRGGKTYTTYLLGQPLAIVPLDILGSRLAVQERWPYGAAVAWVDRLVGPLFGALEATIFCLFALRLGYGLRRSLVLTAVFGFATSVWPDEQSVLEHTEVAFFLLLAFYFAYRFREQHRGWLYLVYSGLALGGAVITRYQDAFLCLLGLGLYLVYPGGRSNRLVDRFRWLVLLGLGLLPSVAVDLWYNWIRFGSVLATGHHEQLFGYPMWKGVPGLLVSPGKGFLWYCPTIFLLAVAGPRFWKKLPALTAGMGVVVVAFVLFYSLITFWHGDPAWGPRYLFPTIPFLTLPLGELLRDGLRRAPAIWAMTVLLVGAGFVIQLSAVSVNQWRTWYRVIAYEESKGETWQWSAFRYHYFWNVHESPLIFQIHGLYQMAYDSFLHRTKYEIVPPDEDPILDGLTTDYAINQWGFWWASNEFDWWMGEQKIILGVTALLAIMLASGTYIAAEATGVFAREPARSQVEPLPEAA